MVFSPPPSSILAPFPLLRPFLRAGEDSAGHVGGIETVWAAGEGEVAVARGEGFAEGFLEGAGFVGEEGGVLGVAVEEENSKRRL